MEYDIAVSSGLYILKLNSRKIVSASQAST